ncbi:MAG: deoxyribose-phosphate aldolase [Tissierellia bacterium]|nr:deoxyribose-phosphate aldolase [Tissierellia bacterium]
MNLERYFDHTNLSPNAGKIEIKKLCDEAIEYGFFSVCIQPCYVVYAKELLKESDIKIATVVGFPQGQNTRATKVFEAMDAIKNGADEIDMVLNFGALKDGRYKEVYEEISQIKEACGKTVLKVIFETSQLSDEQIIKACELSDNAGADFVKTSTGFLGQGATLDQVKLMHKHSRAKVKASGGIRSLEDALSMIEAGASRLGSSSGIVIMQQLGHENV